MQEAFLTRSASALFTGSKLYLAFTIMPSRSDQISVRFADVGGGGGGRGRRRRRRRRRRGQFTDGGRGGSGGGVFLFLP